MKTNKLSFLKFAFVLIFFILFAFLKFSHNTTQVNGHSTNNLIGIFFGFYCPIILIYYRQRIPEFKNKIQMELFKKKRNKIKFFIFIFSWIVMSSVDYLKYYELLSKAEWLKVVLTGLVGAIIILIAICASEYLYLKKQYNNNL